MNKEPIPSDSIAPPSRKQDCQRPFPWFSWISAICLLCFPFFVLGAPITGYYKSPLARITGHFLMVGGLLAPFASLFAVWLAMKRGERDDERNRGCLTLVLAACGLAALGATGLLVEFIRGGS